ncbi:MAG TPA: choice-of-anchor tandem repeat GloVer-containing protein [Verrucomicrobiae bacterium]|nr:choice-of-anchor tandem repeat GloVer-containing protein [Verrucomicrobiae bacterium]
MSVAENLSTVFKVATILAVALSSSLARASSQSYIYEQLYAFPGGTNGYGPEGALVQATNGYFYGTCSAGGQPTSNCPTCGYGTVFRISPAGVFTTLAWFNANGEINGAYPFGQMVQASDGNLYGDSEYGLFRVTPDGVLTGRGGGAWVGDPIQGTDGFLYYVNSDTIFRSPPIWATGMQWSAPGTPSSGLIQATDGNFYGLTSSGGTSGFGTAYKLTPSGTLTTLVSFGGTNIGRWPYGKMLQASDGNLYGVCGSPEQVFKLTLSGTLTTFAVFGTNGDLGYNPNGGLIEANDGNFYGTTYAGGGIAGGSGGTVFKLTPQGRISMLIAFTTVGAYPGSWPLAGLVQGSDGNLYGVCAYGGAYGGGNVFRILMPGPQLNISHTPNQLILSWRTNYTGFTLQGSDGLSPPNWTDRTNSPAVSGGQYWMTNLISSGAQFFRLRK